MEDVLLQLPFTHQGCARPFEEGLAAQKHEDKMWKIRTLAMPASRLLSLSMACAGASGGYPPEIVDKKGQFSLAGMQMEVGPNEEATGRFRVKRIGGVLRLRGKWPARRFVVGD